MNAFLYAAGAGSRLGPELGRRPKILLEIGGRSLLEWHVRRLREAGIDQAHVVVGYQADAVCDCFAGLETTCGVKLHPIVNPHFTEGSVISFEASLPQLRRATGPVLIMDGDVLYPGVLLARLIGSAHRTALLIDRSYSLADDDPVLVPVRDGRPFEFRKQWTGEAECVGESIGFFKVDPADLPLLERATLRRTEGEGRRQSYDEVLRDLVLAGRFGCEDVTGMPWTELDFPGDIAFAAEEVLPRIEALDGAGASAARG